MRGVSTKGPLTLIGIIIHYIEKSENKIEYIRFLQYQEMSSEDFYIQKKFLEKLMSVNMTTWLFNSKVCSSTLNLLFLSNIMYTLKLELRLFMKLYFFFFLNKLIYRC